MRTNIPVRPNSVRGSEVHAGAGGLPVVGRIVVLGEETATAELALQPVVQLVRESDHYLHGEHQVGNALAAAAVGLGETDKACVSYAELAQEFPDAPTHIKQALDRERTRAGCSSSWAATLGSCSSSLADSWVESR